MPRPYGKEVREMTPNCKGCIHKVAPRIAFTPHYCNFWGRKIKDKNPFCTAYDNTTEPANTIRME